LLRVLVSSTFLDLEEDRAAVRRVIDELAAEGHEVGSVAMEDLGSLPSSPLDTSVGLAEQADLVILLVAARYGTIPSDRQRSLTSEEYETAVRRNKVPCLAYLAIPGGEEPDPRVEAFRGQVCEEVTATTYASRAELAERLRKDLREWLITARAQKGELADIDSPPAGAATFEDREADLSALQAQMDDKDVRVGVWGVPGIGKTALIKHFFDRHRHDLFDPIWLRIDELFGRDAAGRVRFGAPRWERRALLETLRNLERVRPRAVLVFDNVHAAPLEVGWLARRLGAVPMMFLSWDMEAIPVRRSVIRLQPLPADAGRRLIEFYCTGDQSFEKDATDELCATLENHPLSLDLAGRWLSLAPSVKVVELTAKLQQTAERLRLEGPTLDRVRVVVRSMLLGSYHTLAIPERQVLSALAAVPGAGISSATVRYLVTSAGRGEISGLERAEQVGLVEGRTTEDWRGHRYRLRSLIREFLETTDAYKSGRQRLAEYLKSRAALEDPSGEVVALALRRQLEAADPELPHQGDWFEPLAVAARPQLRLMVQDTIRGVASTAQTSTLAGFAESALKAPRPKDVTFELIELLRAWAPSSASLRALWLRPRCVEGGEVVWFREVSVAAGKALAESEGRSFSEFVIAGLDPEGVHSHMIAALRAAAEIGLTESIPFVAELAQTHSNSVVRRTAVDTLGGYDVDDDVVALLYERFENDSDPTVRREAAGELGLRKDDRVLGFLLSELGDKDTYTRATACSVLLHYPLPEVAERLADLARNDPAHEVRTNATLCLVEWGDERAAAVCAEALQASDSHEREAAASFIWTLFSGREPPDAFKRTVADELAQWLENESLSRRMTARLALLALKDARAGRDLWRDLLYDVSGELGWSYRTAVVWELATWAPEVEPARLKPLLADPDADMRAAAARLAGQLRARELIPELESLLEDQALSWGESAVVESASEALDRIAGKRALLEPESMLPLLAG
jgi:HEAT repeat protein